MSRSASIAIATATMIAPVAIWSLPALGASLLGEPPAAEHQHVEHGRAAERVGERHRPAARR